MFNTDFFFFGFYSIYIYLLLVEECTYGQYFITFHKTKHFETVNKYTKLKLCFVVFITYYELNSKT